MKASIFSAPLEDLEDAPIYQRPKKFKPNWAEFNRNLSPSERFHLGRLGPLDGLLSFSEVTGTPPFQNTENE